MDFSYFINARIHFNISIIIGCIVSLIPQYLHYKDYKNNKTPTYLKPFEMTEGLVSPQSIGLTDKVQIIQFIKLSKKLHLICNIYTKYLVPFLTLFIPSFVMYFNSPIILFILYVMPINLITTFTSYITYNILLYQLVYFYLICYYLTIRMRAMNDKIRKLLKMKFALNISPVYGILNSMNTLYKEIDEYNSNYWSIFLFWIWILFTAIISVLLFVGISCQYTGE